MSAKKKEQNTLNLSQSEELKVLRKIVEITNSELDVNHTLKEVVKIVNSATKADSVFIYMVDRTQKNLVLMASKTPHKKELGQITLKSGEGITGWVAKENKPVAIPSNASKDKRFKNFDVLPEDRYEAFLSVPIVHKAKAIGVVNVQHKEPHEYSRAAIDLLTLIAKQISGVLENARLYEETKQKALQFDSLNKVSQSITSKDYLDEILNLIVVVTAEMLNSQICSIMLLDKTGEELILKASHSLSVEYTKKPNAKVESTLVGEVVKSQKAIAVFDVQKEKKYAMQELARKEQLTSLLAVPMIVKDAAIGVICVYTKEHHEFTEEEQHVLQIVANQAAVAVQNTKLVEDALKAKEALETRKLIERAKGILMRLNNLSEEAAYRLIHKMSMDSCRPMKDIAESIVLLDDLK